jgi:hypothetical protein
MAPRRRGGAVIFDDGSQAQATVGVNPADGSFSSPAGTTTLISGVVEKSAFGTRTNTGDMIAAVSGKKLYVYHVTLISQATGIVFNVRSGATTALSPSMTFDAGCGYVRSSTPEHPLYVTATGESLALVTTGAVAYELLYFEGT